MRPYLLPLIMCLTVCACSTQSVVLQNGPHNLKQEEMQHFFVSGLGQTQNMNAAQVCGDAQRVTKVERVDTFLNGFLGLLSQGIYTPSTAKVYCN
jgi:hypothetical protein